MNVSDEEYEQFAAVIGGVVEGKPLDDILQDAAGMDADTLLDQAVAPQSSTAARDYAEEQIADEYGFITGDADDDLYLVKAVHCGPQDYEAMATAIDAEDTDKFNVVVGISAEADLIGYDGDEPGLEYTLTAADSPDAAYRAAADTDPHLNASHTNFTPEMAEMIDGHAQTAFYNHEPDDFKAFFNGVSNLLGLR